MTCIGPEHESLAQNKNVTHLSSDEEQPHNSKLPSNPSVSRSSAPQMVRISSEMSIDIGNIIIPLKSNDEICLSMKNFSDSEKYSLLFHHVEPPTVLPVTFSHKYYRKLNSD